MSPSPRVSRLIASLETEIGATLFERTNRRVALTPLEARLRPAYVALLAARDAARQEATGTEGTLRIAFTATTEGPGLTRLVDTFSLRYPDCTVSLVEVGVADPYGLLRSGEADLLYNWLAVDEPGLAHSGPVEHHSRMVAVSRENPLARHQTVTTEDLAGRPVPLFPGVPAAITALFYPTPVLAEMIDRASAEADADHRIRSVSEGMAMVARGQAVWITVASMAAKLARADLALLPVTDLPPLPLGLIWRCAAETLAASVARRRPVGSRAPETWWPPPGCQHNCARWIAATATIAIVFQIRVHPQPP